VPVPAKVQGRPPSLTLNQLRRIVAKRGGTLLSEVYPKKDDYLEIDCGRGHTWRTKVGDVKSGKWCGQCAGNQKIPIEVVVTLAIKRGGLLLNRPKTTEERFYWRCAEGHEWTTQGYRGVRDGDWCPHCAPEPSLTHEALQAIVEKRGGLVLEEVAPDPILGNAKFRLRCTNGHEWLTTGLAIHRGSWCLVCLGLEKGTIRQMHALAAEYGGRCLSAEYTNKAIALAWECEKGHRFEAAPVTLKRGAFCPYCIQRDGRDIGHFFLEDFQHIARERGGECLSTEYTRAQDYLRFRCQLGHEFEAKAQGISRRTWCPECAPNKRPTLDRINARAQELGGTCISKNYVNTLTELQFRCERGHKFALSWNRMQAGVWCRECRKMYPREADPMSLNEMAEWVERLGGECLSPRYEGANHKYQFLCRAGHNWETRPSGLKKGAWCAECTGLAPITIEEMRETASFRGGRCLSSECKGCNFRLDFECAHGHQWSATVTSVRRGSWCPQCFDTAPKLGIERVMQMAKERGGLCISTSYHSPNQRLVGTSHAALRGWCPRCPGSARPVVIHEEAARSEFRHLHSK
jgi:hypothetical protein